MIKSFMTKKHLHLKAILFITTIATCTVANASDPDTSITLADTNPFTISPIHKFISIDDIEGLKAAVLEANAKDKTISVIGAQHSQGGHSIARDGIVLDLKNFNKIYIKEGHMVTVQSGARWFDVLRALAPFGKSVSIMQSDCDFCVGAAVAVNVHGMQAGKGPLIDSINSLNVMLADGNVVTCSSEELPDLFFATIGGYGLTGIIVDVTLRTTDNVMYKNHHIVSDYRDFHTVASSLFR